MSWASRRRTSYLLGVGLFLLVILGVPLAYFLYQAPSCNDGTQNQEETAIDKGGPCPILDERTLSALSLLWSRSFASRDGSYSSVAYIQNSNPGAAVRSISYRFGLYDSKNVLVAERRGKSFIMPGGVTPIFEAAIPTGNREVVRTYFEFTTDPIFERLQDATDVLSVDNKSVQDGDEPRLTADVVNTSVRTLLSPMFVAIVYDPAGNAMAASATTLTRLAGGERAQLFFTWTKPLPSVVSRIDITPLLPPVSER